MTIFAFEMESLDGKLSFLTGWDIVLPVERVVWFLVMGRLCSCSNHLRKRGFLVILGCPVTAEKVAQKV